MALLPIILAPDPRLKVKTRLVAVVDDAVRVLMESMLVTMYAADGIGLAAPQVGDKRRIIVMDCARKNEDPAPIKMANPEIIEVSPDDLTHEEGCLSLPEHFADVVRPDGIRVRYLDEKNEHRELDASGILAICIQHEIDHLNGVLFIDYLGPMRRQIITSKMKKYKKEISQNGNSRESSK